MPNFPGWEEFNVRDYFSDRTGLGVLVDTAAHFLSIALQSLQLLFDPEAFVIGGHLPGPLLASIR
jgi:predicted NBD/HSP70 family sugar kinase